MYTITIKSHTAPDTAYTVTFPDDNAQPPYCTCKGYGYRGTCSHLKEATEQLDALARSAIASAQPNSGLTQRVCTTCGTTLSGTHHKLDKCARCYMHEVHGLAQLG